MLQKVKSFNAMMFGEKRTLTVSVLTTMPENISVGTVNSGTTRRGQLNVTEEYFMRNFYNL